MKIGSKISSYLKVSDFEKSGGGHAAANMTITRHVVENIKRQDGDVEEIEVLYFKETDKGLVLKQTTVNQLGDIFGAMDSSEVAGKRVKLFVDPSVTMAGRRVGGVRIAKAD